jgi:ethanolamine permease
MDVAPDSREDPRQPSELDQVVAEVVSEAHLQAGELRPEERDYLKEHALKKPMGVLHIWALGVGVVITGAYFGWNPGLKEGGPLGMLLASLFVCVLYMLWVLALNELSVVLPFAGGPLAYGRRAVGPWLGFVMGWSMFLESLFATIGTAIATGGAVYFLADLLAADFLKEISTRFQLVASTAGAADIEVTTRLAMTTLFGLLTVVAFAVIQWIGAKEQARLMEWMTYGAIAGLVWFWIAALPGVHLDRVFTTPRLVNGWGGVLKAIPYAIWFLVMIETVALAPEEAHEPHRTIPRGMVLAQVTLIVLVLLTWFFVCAATSDYTKTADVSYPLQQVYQEVWPGKQNWWHLVPFALVALFGMVASYNGMLYAVSRQAFSLGRAGYLPRVLGHVHQTRRTPDVSLAFWSLVVIGFVMWGYFHEDALQVAVLTCNLTALIWYALAIVCLFTLRIREPNMPRPYKVPLYPFVPALVAIMSVFAAGVYIVYGSPSKERREPAWFFDYIVLWLTLFMYAVGLAYYFGFARKHLVSAAPEELAARAERH